MNKPIVVHINEVESFQPPHHMKVISREPVNPQKGARHIRFRITEGEPGGGDYVHIHPHSEQVSYVLEGEAIAIIDGERYVAREGTVIFIPPGMAHKFINEKYVRMLLVWSPPPDLEEWKSLEKG
ncbi:MAG: cupin domain-containing protein [Deltaproteobacteria bacterium]|nr:cupin domain-containing protein [Deltaproteobacteria bacterium]